MKVSCSPAVEGGGTGLGMLALLRMQGQHGHVCSPFATLISIGYLPRWPWEIH